MGLRVGSPAWLDRLCRAVNDSESFAEHGEGWQAVVAFAFEEDDEHDQTVRVLLELDDGRCVGARVVDQGEFEAAEFRLAASCATWQRVLEGGLEPMKSILLHRVQFEGNVLRLVRHLPAAKDLIEAAGTLDAEFA